MMPIEQLQPEPGTIMDLSHGIPDSEVLFSSQHDHEVFRPEINDAEDEEEA